MTKDTTSATTASANPAGMREMGRTSGTAHEFLLICPVKDGGEERFKKTLAALPPDYIKSIDKIGTVHDFRFTIFDNGTRFLFASTYDGNFIQYIKDFSTIVPAEIDLLFSECEGYPGVGNPAVWDYFAKYHVETFVFYSAYPDVSVRQVLKAQRVAKAFENLLDEAQ